METDMHEKLLFDETLLAIYRELDRDRLMSLVVNYARDRLKAGGSSIFLRDDITGRYVLRGTTGLLEADRMPAERIEYEPGEGLTGWIAKRGRSLRISNVRDADELRRISPDLSWSKKYSEISAKPGQAYIGVPILSQDQTVVLGVLRVSGKAEQGVFSEEDEALLNQVAALVSVAIENSQRYEREKRRARYFRLLLDISSELNPRRPIADMLQAVTDGVRQGFRTEGCLIYLQAEDDVHRVVLRSASGIPSEMVGQLSYVAGEGLTGYIFESGQTVQAREAATMARWQDPYLERIAAHLPSGCYRSFIGVPLQLGNEVLGTLELINKIPSAPGHRDWFTNDDEEYLRLLATAIGGVLEGARYLRTLNDVGVTTMRMQRVASFGSLAQRILHETANPLAVARLAASNLQRDLQAILPPAERVEGDTPGSAAHVLPPEQAQRIDRRMAVIENSLNDVGDKLLDLLVCSQRVGMNRIRVQWNDVVREVLIWSAAERQQREVRVHTFYGSLPPIFVEPNELFGILVTALHVAMEALPSTGGVIEVHTALTEDGHAIRTAMRVPQAPQAERVAAILAPHVGAPEQLSPLHFEWALAQETIEAQYGGRLSWQVEEKEEPGGPQAGVEIVLSVRGEGR